MTRRLPITLFLLALCCIGHITAQQYYTVSVTTGAYTDLVNPAPITARPDTLGYRIILPFSMEAFGIPLDFSSPSVAAYAFGSGMLGINVTPMQRLCVFDAFVSQLIWRDSTSLLAYTLEGEAGKKMLKIEWKNLGMIGNSAGDFVNVQLWMSQKDNSFEVHVGPNRVTGTTGYYGYSGPSIGGFVSNYDFSTYYNTFHITGDPSNPGTDELLAYYPMAATPPNGTIYRFAYTKPSAVALPPRLRITTPTFHPNPCTERSRIELPETVNGIGATLILHDLLGREVLRLDDVATGDYIERRDLAPGMYYVSLSSAGHLYDGGCLVIGR